MNWTQMMADLFGLLASLTYILSASLLVLMALKAHSERVERVLARIYPDQYLTYLRLQLAVLMPVAIIEQDWATFLTRYALFVGVCVALAAIREKDGIFHPEEYKKGIYMFFTYTIGLFVITALFMQPVYLSVKFMEVTKLIGMVSAVGIMLIYMYFGQGITLRDLIAAKRYGESRRAGLELQIMRFSGFALFAIRSYMMENWTFFFVNALAALAAFAMVVVYSSWRKEIKGYVVRATVGDKVYYLPKDDTEWHGSEGMWVHPTIEQFEEAMTKTTLPGGGTIEVQRATASAKGGVQILDTQPYDDYYKMN